MKNPLLLFHFIYFIFLFVNFFNDCWNSACVLVWLVTVTLQLAPPLVLFVSSFFLFLFIWELFSLQTDVYSSWWYFPSQNTPCFDFLVIYTTCYYFNCDFCQFCFDFNLYTVFSFLKFDIFLHWVAVCCLSL